MDEFESAVLVSFNPTADAVLRQKASEYCEAVKVNPEGWKFCLEKFLNTKTIEVRFFCLVVVQDTIQYRHDSLPPVDQANLRTALLRYIAEHLPNAQATETPLKNKFAQIVALLFKMEYPHNWPSFFSDILSLLSVGTSSVDIFLRIMSNIDDEIINQDMLRNTQEVARSTEIKDYMREKSIVDVVSAWYQILEMYKTSDVHICKSCLDNIRRYISWIDIGLIANDRFFPLFFSFLNVEDLREYSASCLYELVYKGMPDPVNKLSLVAQLKLTSVFNGLSMNDDPDFLEGVGKVINITGLEIISATKELVAQNNTNAEVMNSAKHMLEEEFMMSLRFMDNDDDNVSQSVYPFINGYLSSVNFLGKFSEITTADVSRQLKSANVTPQVIEQLQALLPIIRKKLTYENDWEDKKDEEEEKFFNDLRKDLVALLKLIMTLSPQLVAQFTLSTLQTVITNLNSATFPTVEVSVYMLLAISEGPASSIKSLESFFGEALVLIANSSILSREKARENFSLIFLGYFDYIRYLPDNPDVLKNVLVSFFDGRSRVCYLFSRMIRSHMTQIQPFLPSILAAVEPFLSPQQNGSITNEDQISIFEALGGLIGGLPRGQQSQYIEPIMSPLINQLDGIVAGKAWDNETPDKPIYTTTIIQILSLAGTISKGFANPAGREESSVWFRKILETSLMLPSLLPDHEEMRLKVLFYMHRMIECLGEGVLQYVLLLIERSLPNCTQKAFYEFVRLLNQLSSRFKETMVPVVDALLPQLTQQFFSYMEQVPKIVTNPPTEGERTVSEFERDIFEVRKQYYSFVGILLNNGMCGVFRSAANVGYLNSVLQCVLQGCREYRDIQSCKSCIIIMRKFAENWIGNVPGFNQFLYEEYVPLIIGEPLGPNFDLNDAGVSLVITEMATSQKTLLTRCGAEFANYLNSIYLPSIGCTPDVSREYVMRLEGSQPKEFRTAFYTFLQSWKKIKKR
ncbi:exportin-T [Planoprotostelium fungivorum]|uniref:Exportin-T n=1 Tax=Planoprotostelium fungivorum TaxID=1890364 RepID=A0A2P6MQH3_9EUKA|nr:exportin-T [Planoprotostelium fungivorum]